MDATRSWSNETVSFTGDQRALSDQDRQLLNNGNSIIPHESDITRDLLDELSRDAVYRVRNYFVSTDY